MKTSEELNELKKQYNKAMMALNLEVPPSIVNKVKRLSDDYRKSYARIQIEKDRERVKGIPNRPEAKQWIAKIIDDLPINLD